MPEKSVFGAKKSAVPANAAETGRLPAWCSVRFTPEGLSKWIPWPVLSERGMAGHGQAGMNTDRTVREYWISQDPPSALIFRHFQVL